MDKYWRFNPLKCRALRHDCYKRHLCFQTLSLQHRRTSFNSAPAFLSSFCTFFIALTLATVWLGLESQTNVRLLWNGHLLHRFSETRPLAAVPNFSSAVHDLQELIVKLSDCELNSPLLWLSAYKTSKKELRLPRSIHPYVAWLSPGNDLTNSVSWQQ